MSDSRGSSTTAAWRNLLTAEEASLIRPQAVPDWCPPMLATLTHKRFSDPDWIFECKLDGVRAMAYRNGDEVRLLTRNHIDISERYPAVMESLCAQPLDHFVVDGELVAFENGISSFSRLQQRLHLTGDAARSSAITVFYYLFDVLHIDGSGLDALPLRTRKKILKQVMTFDHRLRFSAHRNRDGEAYFETACRKGWEGLIAKRADSAYQHHRSADWLKFKCTRRQELVIGGFTDPRRGRVGFGALLVGYFDSGRLRYAGKVGTGYSDAFLRDFRSQLDELEQARSPFDSDIGEPAAHWVRPELVGEFAFTEWTRHGKLRHPSFLGLRDDKAATDVVREDL